MLQQFQLARREGGKAIPRQLFEALKLRLRKSPLGISEYLEYGVWHHSITPPMVDEFIGWRESAELDQRLNNSYSRVLANDKLINHMVLNAARLPAPEPLATFTSEGRTIGTETALRTLDEVVEFIRGPIYPCYVKPISAGFGRGVIGLESFDGQTFTLMDGTSMDLATFLKPFGNPKYRGMLIQKPLVAHPHITELTNSQAISCVRMICIVKPDGPMLHTAFWKITSGRNMVDNFSHGDYGNCLAAVDVNTGRIVRAISRMGPAGTIEKHPSTGKPIVGFTLPDWNRAVDLALRATAFFPGLRLQNWDVALCPDGPVLVELNTESELAVPQAISGRGLKDQRLRDALSAIQTSG